MIALGTVGVVGHVGAYSWGSINGDVLVSLLRALYVLGSMIKMCLDFHQHSNNFSQKLGIQKCKFEFMRFCIVTVFMVL